MERFEAANELAFQIGFSGCSGHLRLEPLPPVQRPGPLSSLPDLILPPASEPETPEGLKKELEERFLAPELDPDEFSPANSGRQWDFEWFDRASVPLEPSVPRSVVVPSWELPFRRGKKDDVWRPKSIEVDVTEIMEAGHDTGTLPRVPGPAKDFVMGSMNSSPFRPGGLDYSQTSDLVFPKGANPGEWVHEVLNGDPPQVVPPGFKQGMDFGPLKKYPDAWKCNEEKNYTRSASDEKQAKLSIRFDDLFKKAWDDSTVEEPEDVDGILSEEESVAVETEVEKVGIVTNPVHDVLPSMLDNILSNELGEAGKEIGIAADGDLKKEGHIIL